MRVHFDDVFVTGSIQKKYRHEELLSLPIQPSFIELISNRLQILYKSRTSEDNTCYADSRELRADYRTTFSRDDILTYIMRGIENYPFYTEHFEIKVPENASVFFNDY